MFCQYRVFISGLYGNISQMKRQIGGYPGTDFGICWIYVIFLRIWQRWTAWRYINAWAVRQSGFWE